MALRTSQDPSLGPGCQDITLPSPGPPEDAGLLLLLCREPQAQAGERPLLHALLLALAASQPRREPHERTFNALFPAKCFRPKDQPTTLVFRQPLLLPAFSLLNDTR